MQYLSYILTFLVAAIGIIAHPTGNPPPSNQHVREHFTNTEMRTSSHPDHNMAMAHTSASSGEGGAPMVRTIGHRENTVTLNSGMMDSDPHQIGIVAHRTTSTPHSNQHMRERFTNTEMGTSSHRDHNMAMVHTSAFGSEGGAPMIRTIRHRENTVTLNSGMMGSDPHQNFTGLDLSGLPGVGGGDDNGGTTTISESRPSTPNNLGGVFGCKDINWQAPCDYNVYPLKFCAIVPANLYLEVSSIGPDHGTKVTAYDTENCMGPSITLEYPGTRDLHQYGWGDRIVALVVEKDGILP